MVAASPPRVTADDGMRTVTIEVDGFTVDAKKPPTVYIVSPAEGTTSLENAPVFLSASVYDPEDGQLPDLAIEWSSNIDGPLGTGPSMMVDTLTVGNHELSVTATDSDALVGSHSVVIEVTQRPAPMLSDFNVDGAVDEMDYVNFVRCLAGPGSDPALDCPPGMNPDVERDGDVDLRDFGIFQRAFTGEP